MSIKNRKNIQFRSKRYMKNKILLTVLLALTTFVGYDRGMESEPTRESL